MDNRYRDESQLHHASPILAVLVAAMTLATAPLTQAGHPSAGSFESEAGRSIAGRTCSNPIGVEICETRAFMALADDGSSDDLASLPIDADVAAPMSDG